MGKNTGKLALTIVLRINTKESVFGKNMDLSTLIVSDFTATDVDFTVESLMCDIILLSLTGRAEIS